MSLVEFDWSYLLLGMVQWSMIVSSVPRICELTLSGNAHLNISTSLRLWICWLAWSSNCTVCVSTVSGGTYVWRYLLADTTYIKKRSSQICMNTQFFWQVIRYCYLWDISFCIVFMLVSVLQAIEDNVMANVYTLTPGVRAMPAMSTQGEKSF